MADTLIIVFLKFALHSPLFWPFQNMVSEIYILIRLTKLFCQTTANNNWGVLMKWKTRIGIHPSKSSKTLKPRQFSQRNRIYSSLCLLWLNISSCNIWIILFVSLRCVAIMGVTRAICSSTLMSPVYLRSVQNIFLPWAGWPRVQRLVHPSQYEGP